MIDVKRADGPKLARLRRPLAANGFYIELRQWFPKAELASGS
jgi:hypothetical protein